MYEKGASVNQSDLSKNTSTVTGGENTSVEKQSGYKVNDGRKEEAEVKKPDESTIVFRSYKNPDSENAVIDLKAKYVNKLRTGSISLKKELSNGESETQAGRNYKFIIEYRNVAGMKLEANTGTDVIKQEIELEANEQQIITGIPAGTDYTIYEEIPESADYSLEKVKVTVPGNDKNVKAENNVVTGIVVADDGDNPTSTAVTFMNTVTPLISISGTKTWEGGETADTPDNIVVQIQRLNPDTKEYEQAKDKLGELIPNQIVDIKSDWKYTFTGLLKYVDYKVDPKVECDYRVVELGTLRSSEELGDVTPDPQNPAHIKPIAGYYPEYKDGSFDITNKKTGTLKIIKKTGKNDFLQGAEFTLYTDSNTTQVAKDHSGNDLTGTTGGNGELIFNNIITGTEENPITYYLKEVKTKAGYVLLKEPIKITLPYKATLNDQAVLGQSGNTNAVSVTYKNTGDVDRKTEPTGTPKVFTYGIDLLKKGEGVDKLVGVKFTLTDENGKGVNVEKKDSNNFYTPGGSSNTVTTDNNGKIYIRGLKPGTYKLTETKTNNGYVRLKDPVVIVITPTNAETGAATATVGSKDVTMTDDNGSLTAKVPLTVVNSKGFDLPATGGRGIALFTIAGIAIVVAAGTLLFIQNCQETLTYRVSEIEIILPDESDKIMIRPGRNMVTLMTCHPYTQNSRRYVVYCDEVGTQPEKTADTTADTAEGVGSSRQENVTSEQNRTEAIAEDQRLIERDTLWRKAGYAGIGLIGVLIIFGFIPRKKH